MNVCRHMKAGDFAKRNRGLNSSFIVRKISSGKALSVLSRHTRRWWLRLKIKRRGDPSAPNVLSA